MRTLLAAAVVAAGLGVPAQAALLDFSFSFSNFFLNGGGTVTGVVRGLTDNATSAASSVEVTGNTAGFGFGEYVGNPTPNSFTVLGATITAANFISLGENNSAPDAVCCSLALLANGNAGLSQDPDALFHPPAGLTFTQIPPIPLPAALSLMVAALLGLAGIGLRRRA